MKPAVIYHVFWRDNGRDAYNDMQVPVVLAISTLRAVNPTIPIYVLECGQVRREWSHFPEKLHFSVVYADFELEKKHHAALHSASKSSVVCSRLSDVNEFAKQIPEDLIIYSDADVFWLRDPLPLDCAGEKRFCLNNNTGFFYYDKNSSEANWFLDVFQSYLITSLYNDDFCRRAHKINRWDTGGMERQRMWLEPCLQMVYKDIPDCCCSISKKEHGFWGCEDPKMFHPAGLNVEWDGCYHLRGFIPFLMLEFYHLVESVLSESDFKLIYRGYLRFLRSVKKVSFHDKLFNIALSKSKSGGKPEFMSAVIKHGGFLPRITFL